MGEIFREMTAQKKERKECNHYLNTQELIHSGVKFKSLNDGYHLQIELNRKKVNFWPSTNLVMYEKKYIRNGMEWIRKKIKDGEFYK